MGGRLHLDSAGGGALDILETQSPLWIPIILNVLEMRSDYFSMNDGVVQKERPITHSTSRSRKGGHAVGLRDLWSSRLAWMVRPLLAEWQQGSAVQVVFSR